MKTQIKKLNLKETNELKIKVKGNEIILFKVKQFNPKSLEELFIRYKGTY